MVMESVWLIIDAHDFTSDMCLFWFPLCQYGPRQTMKLLMHEISSPEASEIIFRYGTEGKIIELASLLIASS